MITPLLSATAGYFTPRSRSSKLCLLLVTVVIFSVLLGLKSGVLQYHATVQALNMKHYSLEELSEIIPFEDDVQRIHSETNSEEASKTTLPTHCSSWDPKTVFVIRIAKCASTSFVDILKKLSKRSVFELFFHPSGAYDWDFRTTKQVADVARAKHNKFVYARHFYFVDFHQFELQDYTYVTFIREPVSRFVSSFLYYHFSSKAYIQSILNPAHKNETILTCVKQKHEGCAHNLMTKYFCGHHRFCQLGNEQALDTAMKNINEFAFIGIIEEMDLSLKLLAKTIPSYFSSLLAEEVKVTNQNEHRKELTEAELQAVRQANLADIKLYEHIKEILYLKANSCKM